MERKSKDIGTFFYGLFLSGPRQKHIYFQCHQGTKCKHFNVRDVIYHKFSHGAASCMLNWESVNVMLEY